MGNSVTIVLDGSVGITTPQITADNIVGNLDISTPQLNAGNIVGQVCFFARSTAPIGFLKCNGAAISRTTYAALFNAIGTTYGGGNGSTTFNLPDARGEFLRGWDDGRGVDGGRSFASFQADEFKNHQHEFGADDQMTAQGGYTVTRFIDYDARSDLVGGGRGVLTKNALSNFGGNETRPRNIALLACIKF
jgi:microcystin-dependent protein